MIERLRIKNFQKHKSIDIEFSPTITSIVGETDAGKSAIFRALQWVVLNQPTGDAFKRHGAGEVRAQITWDGQKITRSRGEQNQYRLDSQIFKAFGTNPPKDVTDLFRMTEVNFQGQHDPLFWISLPSSQLSQEINSIVDMGEVGRLTQAITKKAGKASSDLEAWKTIHDERSKRMETLKRFPTFAAAVASLNRDAEEHESLVARLGELEHKHTALDILEHRLRHAGILQKRVKEVSELKRKHLQVKETWIRAHSLYLSLTRQQSKIESLRKRISTICPTCGQPRKGNDE